MLMQYPLRRGVGCTQHQALPGDPNPFLLPARPGQALPTALQQPSSRHTAQPALPVHRPLPRLKDHLFFQRLENDGQEWLSSESDIWEPCARYNPRQETTAQSTAELSTV